MTLKTDLVAAMLQSSIPFQQRRQLSAGLTTLNLLLSGDSSYGVESGSVVWISGPSGSGRTTLALTLLAEAAQNPEFSGFRLLYENTEGQNVDIAAYFGRKTAKRVQSVESSSPDTFWSDVADTRPSIRVLDSLDGLNLDSDWWRINNNRANTAFNAIRASQSILIITAQEKEIDGKKVTAGGFAVPFYADYSIKTVDVGPITRVVKRKERIVGTQTAISVTKSRNGMLKLFQIPVPIFFGTGYDNAEALFMFLVRKGMIKEKNGVFVWPLFGLQGSRFTMVEEIRSLEALISSWLETNAWVGQR